MTRAAVWLSLTVLLAGCHVGPRVEQMPFARDPAGAEVTVVVEMSAPEYRRGRYAGELLEVSASEGLLVAVRGDRIVPRLTWFRWNAVHEIDAKNVPSVGRKLWLPGASRLDLIGDLTLVARYSQGLSPALRDQLRERYRQSQFDVIEDADKR